MKKIALFPGVMESGGVESVILNWLDNIDTKEYQFTLFVSREKQAVVDKFLYEHGCAIVYIGTIKKKGFINYIRNVIRLLKDSGPYDCIHINGIYTTVIHIIAGKRAHIKKIIYHVHNTEDVKLRSTLLGRAFMWFARFYITKNATALIACGQLAGESIYGKKANFKILRNAIDTRVFHRYSPEKIRALKEKFEIDPQILLLTCVGRFSRIKNQCYLIRVINNLKNKITNIRCVFIGDGETINECRQLVNQYNLQNYIFFWGVRNDIADILNCTDVFFLPSLHEGVPVSVIEAQACGVPCVLSDVITREVNLGIVPIEWIDILSESIDFEKMIRDLTKKKELSNSAIKEKIRIAKYDTESIIDNLSGLYE